MHPSEIPDGLDIDWNRRYTFAELEAQLSAMAEQYPDITDLYSIGTTWQERDLWCLEITNKAIPGRGEDGDRCLRQHPRRRTRKRFLCHVHRLVADAVLW